MDLFIRLYAQLHFTTREPFLLSLPIFSKMLSAIMQRRFSACQ